MPLLTFHLGHRIVPPMLSRTGVTCSTRPISAVSRPNSLVSRKRHCPTCQRHRIATADHGALREQTLTRPVTGPASMRDRTFSVVSIPGIDAVGIVQGGCRFAGP